MNLAQCPTLSFFVLLFLQLADEICPNGEKRTSPIPRVVLFPRNIPLQWSPCRISTPFWSQFENLLPSICLPAPMAVCFSLLLSDDLSSCTFFPLSFSVCLSDCILDLLDTNTCKHLLPSFCPAFVRLYFCQTVFLKLSNRDSLCMPFPLCLSVSLPVCLFIFMFACLSYPSMSMPFWSAFKYLQIRC